jgi:hypothetical protein
LGADLGRDRYSFYSPRTASAVEGADLYDALDLAILLGNVEAEAVLEGVGK